MTQRSRLALLAVAALLAAVGASTLAFAAVHQKTAFGTELSGDATWAAGSHPAPQIRLRDQSGHDFSLKSLRGHVVMLTFLYSHCREICPTVGAQLSAIQRSFPLGQRPAIVVVSVDPAGDTALSVRTFAADSGWPGPWHWLMGNRQHLAPTWQAYGIDVRPLKTDLAHSGAVYLIDKAGDERSGYLAPIPLPLVEQDVRALTESGNPSGLPVLPLIWYLFTASVAAAFVIRLRIDPRPDEGRSNGTTLIARLSRRLVGRPATTVLCTTAIAVLLTVVAVETDQRPFAAGSSSTDSVTSSSSGAVLPISARKPSPSLHGATPLLPRQQSLQIPRGQITFVNFWASWCPPCQQEAPDLARFANALPDGVSLIGVDVNDRSSDALAFMRRYGLSYRVVSDSSGSILRRFGGLGLPTTVVIDQRGRIAVTLFGPQTTTSLEAILHTLQAER